MSSASAKLGSEKNIRVGSQADRLNQTPRRSTSSIRAPRDAYGRIVRPGAAPNGCPASRQRLRRTRSKRMAKTSSKTRSREPRGAAPQTDDAPSAVAHFTAAERAARGKAARAEVPRSTHAGWEPTPNRRDPVALLEEQARTRLPELVPIRYGRMLVSPFTFFRGAAYVMAADLADGARTGLHVQLCGDAHLSNFGFFAAPDRRLVFSINDFDETLPGPFEWDVKRLPGSPAGGGPRRGGRATPRHATA